MVRLINKVKDKTKKAKVRACLTFAILLFTFDFIRQHYVRLCGPLTYSTILKISRKIVITEK